MMVSSPQFKKKTFSVSDGASFPLYTEVDLIRFTENSLQVHKFSFQLDSNYNYKNALHFIALFI